MGHLTMAREAPFFIGGKWRASHLRLDVTNPYDQSLVGTTFLATEADVESAIAAAVSAFEETRVAPAW